LKAFSSLDSFSTEFRFRTWLLTIGYRVCLNRLRRRRFASGDAEILAISVEPGEDAPTSLATQEASQLREQIWQAVDQLSVPQRAAVLLFYRVGLGCHEIARVLELPVATVKSHLHRARARLREMLEALSEHDLEEFRNRSAQAG